MLRLMRKARARSFTGSNEKIRIVRSFRGHRFDRNDPEFISLLPVIARHVDFLAWNLVGGILFCGRGGKGRALPVGEDVDKPAHTTVPNTRILLPSGRSATGRNLFGQEAELLKVRTGNILRGGPAAGRRQATGPTLEPKVIGVNGNKWLHKRCTSNRAFRPAGGNRCSVWAHPRINYCNFAYSTLTCFRMGMSGSASLSGCPDSQPSAEHWLQDDLFLAQKIQVGVTAGPRIDDGREVPREIVCDTVGQTKRKRELQRDLGCPDDSAVLPRLTVNSDFPTTGSGIQ